MGFCAPKSTTGTLLMGHSSPWEAVTTLYFLLGLLLSVASFSPVLLSHVRNGCLLASFLVLVLPLASSHANGHFYLLFPFLKFSAPV